MKLKFAALLCVVLFAAGCGSSKSGTHLTSGTVYETNPPNSVLTVAGSAGATGTADGIGTQARFGQPNGVAVSPDGTQVYVADYGNNAIRQVVVATSSVSTIAGGSVGFANGTGTNASFNGPHNLASDGTNLYVTDFNNNAVRQVVIATGAVTTLAGSSAGIAGTGDGVGTAATFSKPSGIAITPDLTTLYVTDNAAGRIRKIDIASKTVTTLATNLLLTTPAGIVTDGTSLYVTEFDTCRVVKVQISNGATTVVAGGAFFGSADGAGSAASFLGPNGVTLLGGNLFVTDHDNHLIRKIVPPTGVVTTVAGVATVSGATDGSGAAATFNFPIGIATDGTRLYVGDAGNRLVRRIQ